VKKRYKSTLNNGTQRSECQLSGTTRTGNFLTSQAAVSFSIMTRFHGLRHDSGNLVHKVANSQYLVTDCVGPLFFLYSRGPGFEDRSVY
jgi:hypothetical protein